MNNKKKKRLPIMFVASILLSGCADNTPVEFLPTPTVETTTTTTITTSEITTEEILEVPYMETFLRRMRQRR